MQSKALSVDNYLREVPAERLGALKGETIMHKGHENMSWISFKIKL